MTKKLKTHRVGYATKKTSATPLCPNCPKFVISSRLLALPKEAVRGKRPTDNHKKPTKVKIKVRKLLLTLCSCRRRESSFPAISYWVACQTSNGALVNLFKIPRAVGASRKIGIQNLNILYQVLKDHKNPCGMQLVESPYQNCLRRVFCLVVSIIAYYVASVLQEELNVDVHSQ